jgi:hypothetical protein
MIRALENDGYDTTAAESLLRTLLTTLAAFEHHQRQVENERFRCL